MYYQKKAVTLTEVLVAVVILGILAGLAYPRFIKSTESTRAREAEVALRQIHAGQRIYRNSQGTYFPDPSQPPANSAGIYNNLRIRVTETEWTYNLDTNNPSDFTATATRIGGGNIGETITINESGVIGGTWSP